MTRAVVVALGALALAGCGGDGEPATEATEPWPGPPPAAADGTVQVEEFNHALAARPDWARTPLLAAAAFHGDRPPGEGGEVSLVQESESTVTLVEDDLPDDSIRAVRYELRFERGEDGLWRLASAQWSQRCREGRGHQEFAPEPCV